MYTHTYICMYIYVTQTDEKQVTVTPLGVRILILGRKENKAAWRRVIGTQGSFLVLRI